MPVISFAQFDASPGSDIKGLDSETISDIILISWQVSNDRMTSIRLQKNSHCDRPASSGRLGCAKEYSILFYNEFLLLYDKIDVLCSLGFWWCITFYMHVLHNIGGLSGFSQIKRLLFNGPSHFGVCTVMQPITWYACDNALHWHPADVSASETLLREWVQWEGPVLLCRTPGCYLTWSNESSPACACAFAFANRCCPDCRRAAPSRPGPRAGRRRRHGG